MGQTFKVKI